MRRVSKSYIGSRAFVIVIALGMVLPATALLSGQVNAETPNEEFLAYGMVYNEDMTPINEAKVMARNMDTGDMLSTTSVEGYYEINIAEMPKGVNVGDFIVVEADDGASLGEEDFTVEAGMVEKNIDIVIIGTSSSTGTLSPHNPIHYRPDVVALSLYASDDKPIEGDVIKLVADIKNAGEVYEDKFDISFYLDIIDNAHLIGTAIAPELDLLFISYSKQVSISWNTANHVGEHTIYVMLDPENKIKESNETNNIASVEVSVLSPEFLTTSTADQIEEIKSEVDELLGCWGRCINAQLNQIKRKLNRGFAYYEDGKTWMAVRSVNQAVDKGFLVIFEINLLRKIGKLDEANATLLITKMDRLINDMIDITDGMVNTEISHQLADAEHGIADVRIYGALEMPDNVWWKIIGIKLSLALNQYQKAMVRTARGWGIQWQLETANVILKEARAELKDYIADEKIPEEFGETALGMIADVILAYPPDLEVTYQDIDIEGELIKGETNTITVTVHNIGDVSVSDVKVDIYDEPREGESSLIDSITFTHIAADGVASDTIEWTPIAAGTHYIKAVVDPIDEIVEADEENNEAGNGVYVIKGTPHWDGGKTVRSGTTESYEDTIIRMWGGNLYIESDAHLIFKRNVIFQIESEATPIPPLSVFVNESATFDILDESTVTAQFRLRPYKFFSSGVLNIRDSTVQWMWGDATDYNKAGGIQLYSGTCNIENSEIREGRTHNIYCDGVSPNIVNSNITDAGQGEQNIAYGIFAPQNSSLTIKGGMIDNNLGHGVYAESPISLIQNVNITNHPGNGIFLNKTAESVTLDYLSDGSTTKSLNFAAGFSEYNLSANFSIPKRAVVVSAKMTLMGDGGVLHPALDVGNDDDNEWSYTGWFDETVVFDAPEFMDELNSHIPETGSGNVIIPLNFTVFRSQVGSITISDIEIIYEIIPRIEQNNITDNSYFINVVEVKNETVYGPSVGGEMGPIFLANDNIIDCSLFADVAGEWVPMDEGVEYFLDYATGEIDISPIAPMDLDWTFYAYYNYTERYSGIALRNLGRVVVVNNTVKENFEVGFTSPSPLGYGISVVNCTNISIIGNHVNNNYGYSIVLSDTVNSTVEKNILQEDLHGWSPNFDRNIPTPWSAPITDKHSYIDKFYRDPYCLEIRANGQYDDGTFWVEKKIPAEPFTTTSVTLEFFVWDHPPGAVGGWSMVAYADTSRPEEEDDFAKLGPPTLPGWNRFTYDTKVFTGDSASIWVAVGYSINWETTASYYFDHIRVSTDTVSETESFASSICGIWLDSSSNNTLVNNTVLGKDFGVYQSGNGAPNTIEGNRIIRNRYHGIYLANSQNSTLRNNTAHLNDYGVYLSDFENISLVDIDASFNRFGIYAYNATGKFENLTMTNNEVDGAVLHSSSNVEIYNSTFDYNGLHGLYLTNASNNRVENCSLNLNDEAGLYLANSSDSNILRNLTVGDEPLGPWIPDSDSSFNPIWDITYYNGRTEEDSALVFNLNTTLSVSGAIWIVRKIPVKPNRTIPVDIRFCFYTENLTSSEPWDAMIYVGLTPPEHFDEFTIVGKLVESSGLGFQTSMHDSTTPVLETGTNTTLWVAVGINATAAGEGTIYLDTIYVETQHVLEYEFFQPPLVGIYSNNSYDNSILNTKINDHVWLGIQAKLSSIEIREYCKITNSSGGIVLIETTNSFIDNCIIGLCGSGISCKNSSVNITNNLIIYNGYYSINYRAEHFTSVNMTNNNISSSMKFGIFVNAPLSTINVTSNNISEHGYAGITSYGTTLTILDNNISHNRVKGIYLFRPSSSVIKGNNISYTDYYGIACIESGSPQIGGDETAPNNITNNKFGVFCGVFTVGLNPTVTYNNIFSNTEFGVYTAEPAEPPVGIGPFGVDATYCWWGAPDGPSGVGTGSGDAVSTYVIYEPYSTTPWP